jgi:hypothetical protein
VRTASDATVVEESPAVRFTGESLLHAVVENNVQGALRTRALSSVLRFKWERYGRWHFLRETLVYLAYVALCSVILLAGTPVEPSCARSADAFSDYSVRDWIGSRFAYLFLGAATLYFVGLEVAQVREIGATSSELSARAQFLRGLRGYLLDAFNLTDLACYGIGLSLVPLRWSCGTSTGVVSPLTAVFLLLLWVKILPYFQGFPAGRYTRIFYHIIGSIFAVTPPAALEWTLMG